MLTHSDHFFKMSIQHSINVTEHKKKHTWGHLKLQYIDWILLQAIHVHREMHCLSECVYSSVYLFR